eukprot:CAMPEP_0204038692 /NCGR_PEP_ID=MMETSP0360-20130528/88372_1 /ASSEMBLY_ACC=CAM_ASM_000342 /TAXON_ID=268821 /ORGANISM="Scrippsiella Hangoei, Strain SHTV-5" /LENGTH=51 /DNA_ID=CAMNT_0050984427 /DNA_START=123 /DNA_END=275 /DNA_ORIENTATION=-
MRPVRLTLLQVDASFGDGVAGARLAKNHQVHRDAAEAWVLLNDLPAGLEDR